MLWEPQSLPRPDCRFRYGGSGSRRQEEAHLSAKRGGSAFQQATLTLQQLTLFTVERD